jgi:uncharacterized protein involved in outer membrane biogenesis
MNPNVTSRLSSLKRPLLIIVGVLATLLLFLWLALPRIIQSQAEKFVAEKTGHLLTLDLPEFNPFEWRLRLHKLQLSEPDGKPLLAFEDFVVDLSAASLTRRAFVFDAIRLDGLAVTLVEQAGGTLNWTPFLDSLKSKEEKPADANAALPRIDIQSFVLSGGKLDFADRRSTPGFATRVEPLDLTLSDISTLPDDEGKFKIAALTSLGAQIELSGAIDLNPVAVNGTLSLAGLQLAKLAHFLQDALPAPPEGVAGLTAHYQVGNGGDKLDATVDQIEVRITGLNVPLGTAGGGVAAESIELQAGRFELAKMALGVGAVAIHGGKLNLPKVERSLQFADLSFAEAQVNLAERQATVASVALEKGNLHATFAPDGKLYILAGLQALAASQKPQKTVTGQSDEAATPPWHFRVDKVSVRDLDIFMQDERVAPAAELVLNSLMLDVEGVSDDLKVPLPVKLGFNFGAGGRFESAGKYTPAGPVADINFKLDDLALQIAQPYLAAQTTLKVTDGKLSTKGRVTLNDKGPNAFDVRGEFAVNNLRLTESGTGNTLLAWKTFGSRAMTLTPKELNLGELRLGGLDTQLIIDKDKNINFKKVLKQSGGEPAAPAVPAPAAAPANAALPADPPPVAVKSAPKAPPPAFVVNIDRLRFYKGEMDFADHSLILPFGTRIHNLRGSIAGLSNRPDAVGQIELDGEVDDYGMARAVGHVELGNPTNSLDMRVQFRNVEMTRLTPYVATFAGRKIESGKLSLDLQYKIKQRQLQGENQVIMDKLTLGERIESPTAQDLPLDLAIAILQDSDGRIDLGLPVSGSLDDPEFSYGSIVWKAIKNVLTKIVTAPFRALGALFGGDGEAVENIVFEAGAPQLTPPEREKLVRLAEAMAKRPALNLSVGGIYTDADRVALQEVQLRRAVLVQSGQRVPEKGDPGPVSTQQPKIREALETLYKDRVGASDLAALKEGFRSANPGQLEEGMTGKVMSRVSGLMREKKTLNESEVAQLKGADFYSVLFEKLRAKEVIADERLQVLAQARGENAVEILKSAGVSAERVQLLPPEQGKLEGDGASGEIPLRMSLESAKAAK